MNINETIVKFVREYYKEYTGNIYLHEPRFIGNEKKYLNDAIDSTFVSSIGKYVDRFESMMAEVTGAKYAVAVTNGTAALHIALKLAGVNRNDEVLCQPLTFVATANAISYEGAIPHFVDVDVDTMGLSPNALRARLDEIAVMRNGRCVNKQTGRTISACVPMHTFGLALRIDEIVEICDQYNITVVEDAAESLGTYYKKRHTGVFGLVGTFSFNGNKIITSGGGGAIVTNNQELAKKAKHISTTAKIPHKWKYEHDHIAYNYRMPNLNAALVCAQLEQLELYLENKRNTARSYNSFFKDLSGVKYIEELQLSKSNYWLNAILFDSEIMKEDFLSYSNSNGVMTRPIWELMNDLIMYKDSPKGDLSNSEFLAKRVVNLPSSVKL